MTIRTENNNVAVRFPTTDKRSKKVWCTDTGEWWNSAKECASEIGVSDTMLTAYDNIQSAFAYVNQLKAERAKLDTEIADAERKLSALLNGSETNG